MCQRHFAYGHFAFSYGTAACKITLMRAYDFVLAVDSDDVYFCSFFLQQRQPEKNIHLLFSQLANKTAMLTGEIDGSVRTLGKSL